jgi:hypothetical protein
MVLPVLRLPATGRLGDLKVIWQPPHLTPVVPPDRTALVCPPARRALLVPRPVLCTNYSTARSPTRRGFEALLCVHHLKSYKYSGTSSAILLWCTTGRR